MMKMMMIAKHRREKKREKREKKEIFQKIFFVDFLNSCSFLGFCSR